MTEILGIQEMQRRFEKTEAAKDILSTIKETMERQKYFDFDEANPYGTGSLQRESGITPMSRDDAVALANSIKNVPLREFLAKSGTTGIAGAAYLIPTKIHSTLYEPAVQRDILADISMAVLPPEQLPGTTTKVDILTDGSNKVWTVSSGATMPTETLGTTQATLDFSKTYGVNIRIAQDLIEDSQWDLIETHIRGAGMACGDKSSELAATVLYTATDGDGTANTITGDQAYTEFATDAGSHTIEEAMAANLADNFVPDTWLLTHKAFMYNVKGTAGAAYAEVTANDRWIENGYPTRFAGMNMVYSDIGYLNAAAAKSVVFSKQFALLSGRKRWLRIENYAEPIKDLVGAVVTFRQDSVTVYNDSIAPYAEGS